MKKSILTSLVCGATLTFFSSCANQSGTGSSSGGTPSEQMRSGEAGGSPMGRGTGPSGSTDRPATKKGRTVETGGAGGTGSGSGSTSKKKSSSGSGSSSDASPSPSPSPSE